ncbi:cytochrome-c oxidase [Bacillus taeanensis]|uniref:Cytochrome-c oxidase n=1 Tax=Bacillus taeanensis TaxID=273032 RepID=A0A366XSK1_9BACI|nr:cytochrome-c oxidase [Bacillus taeanensis]RBW69360.1 cytochrome-c oxidase [Bacillus taeanensis]
MGINLIKISVVYFLIGVSMGMFMSMSHQFNLTPVHVHINLLGWTSLTLAGLLYHFFPKAGESMLEKIHFWLHNIGLPIMMIGLSFVVYGKLSFEPIIAVGGTITWLSILLFVINIIKNVQRDTSIDQNIQNDKGTSI